MNNPGTELFINGSTFNLSIPSIEDKLITDMLIGNLLLPSLNLVPVTTASSST